MSRCHTRGSAACFWSACVQSHIGPRHDASALHIERYAFLRCRDKLLSAASTFLSCPEVLPIPSREHDIAAGLARKERRKPHAIAHHVLIVDRRRTLIFRSVEHESPEGRSILLSSPS